MARTARTRAAIGEMEAIGLQRVAALDVIDDEGGAVGGLDAIHSRAGGVHRQIGRQQHARCLRIRERAVQRLLESGARRQADEQAAVVRVAQSLL